MTPLEELESKVGGATTCMRLIGVHKSPYYRYIAEPQLVPQSVRHSVEAHLLLGDEELAERIESTRYANVR